MQIKWALILFFIFCANTYASDEMVDYFYVDGVNINKIYTSQSEDINSAYKIVVAYAINTNTSWKNDVVGVFLVSENSIEIFDIFPSERQKDFLPSIEALTSKELIVSVNSDYGELKKIKYIIDLKAEKKLVSRIELQPKGIPDDLH